MLEKNYTKCEERYFFTQLGYGVKDIAFDIRDWFIWLFEDFLGRLKVLWEKIRNSNSWQLAGILVFVGIFCFLYTLITEGGTIPLSGDFELQGMTFIYNGYDDWHYYFETGVFPLWDTSGILGVSNIAANSFYYLFDPFFLVLLIFPRAFLSQAQSIVTISKLVLAGIFFYHYLKSFNLKISTRKVGALAYAFCGWGWFYAWFFHFAEVMTFFPLMLWGVERCLQKKDPRLLVLSVLLMGATNYQFLAVFGVLSFIYAMFRYFQTIGHRSLKGNFSALGIGFFGFAIGLLLTGFIVIPNYLSIQSMPRVTSASYLTNLFNAETLFDTSEVVNEEEVITLGKLSWIFKWDDSYAYRANYPLISLIFMNVKCFTPTLYYTTSYDNSGCSLYIFGPLLLLLIPSFIDAVKNKKISQIIAVILLAVAVETPFIYYAAGAFANAYGRWELFVTTSMITFVCVHLDNVKNFKGWYFDVSALVVAGAFYYFQKTALADADAYTTLKTLYTEETWMIPGEGIYLILVYLFLRFRFKRPHFRRDILYIVGVEAIIMGNVTVAGHGTYSYESSLFGGHDLQVEQTKIVSELSKTDDSFYRIFNSQAGRSANNLAMVEGYNGVGTFNSVYNYESDELLNDWSRISYNGSWSFGVHLKRNNLDELLGIKYYLLSKDDINIPYGCVDVSNLTNYSQDLKDCLYSESNPDGDFKLYLNTNFVDTAFAFDSYMNSNLMLGAGRATDPENRNEINYLKRAIIDDDYLDENSALFENFDKENSLAFISQKSATSMLLDETVYSANWDTQDQGGAYRTLDPDMTDVEYNAIHHDELVELAGQEDSNVYYSENYGIYKYSSNENNFFVSPGDSIISAEDSGTSVLQSSLYGLKYYSKVVFDDTSFTGVPTPIVADDASSREGAYVSISSKFGYNVDFYLYGYDSDTETYHVITHDQHMQNNFGKSADWKYGRGFYVDEPVYKIVGVVKETMSASDIIYVEGLYCEYNDEYQEDVDALKADAINVTYRDANTLDYTSNYNKEKIVVLNVPYDEGWSLQESYTDDNDIKVESEKEYFKADGGLIGYIAPEGETSYHLSYYTPGLKTGLVITDVGLTFSAAMIGIFYSLNYSKKLEARIRKVYSLKEL